MENGWTWTIYRWFTVAKSWFFHSYGNVYHRATELIYQHHRFQALSTNFPGESHQLNQLQRTVVSTVVPRSHSKVHPSETARGLAPWLQMDPNSNPGSQVFFSIPPDFFVSFLTLLLHFHLSLDPDFLCFRINFFLGFRVALPLRACFIQLIAFCLLVFIDHIVGFRDSSQSLNDDPPTSRSSMVFGRGQVVRALPRRMLWRSSCTCNSDRSSPRWVCLKMSCTPKPNGFADHYPY